MSDEDRLLDHSYDGIQEFDNPLPGWWKWLFWASIGYSFLYVLYFHVGVGPSVLDDFDTARAAYFEVQEAKFADLEINEATLAQLTQDEDLMAAQEKNFVGKCATCHRADGGGLACPNLTDDFWLHGGTRMDIYATIRDGVAGKAMESWLDQLGPVGVLWMAAYVDTLRGKNVEGRAQEGTYFDPAQLESAPPAGEDPGSAPDTAPDNAPENPPSDPGGSGG